MSIHYLLLDSTRNEIVFNARLVSGRANGACVHSRICGSTYFHEFCACPANIVHIFVRVLAILLFYSSFIRSNEDVLHTIAFIRTRFPFLFFFSLPTEYRKTYSAIVSCNNNNNNEKKKKLHVNRMRYAQARFPSMFALHAMLTRHVITT